MNIPFESMLHGAARNRVIFEIGRGIRWTWRKREIRGMICQDDPVIDWNREKTGSPVRIRTSINGVRVRGITIIRQGSAGAGQ